MKAAVFYEHGGPEKIQIAEVPRPEIGRGEVLVQVKACALNHLDLWVRRGLPGLELKLPFWSGSDVAGVVAEVGADVVTIKPGDRVIINPSLSCGVCEYCMAGEESLCVDFKILGEHVPGGCAEFVAAPAGNLMRLPDGFSFEEAAAVPLVFQTAWRALITQARLRPGEDVLILGASGGAATAAIQIARLAGARVFAVTSRAEKINQAKELGAEVGINRTEVDFAREVWKLTDKRGVDVVLENVGSPTWKQSLRCLARGGRLVTYGATAGPIGETDIRVVFWKQIHIIGSTMSNRKEFADVMRLIFQRRLRPVIDKVLPLEEARAAHERLEAGEQFGKIVLQIASARST